MPRRARLHSQQPPLCKAGEASQPVSPVRDEEEVLREGFVEWVEEYEK